MLKVVKVWMERQMPTMFEPRGTDWSEGAGRAIFRAVQPLAETGKAASLEAM